jgi:hypothetical protein
MKRIAGKAHTIKYWKCMWRKITKNKNAHKKEGRKEEGGRNMKETSLIFIGQLVSGKPELKHRMTGPKFVFTYYNVCIIFYKLILFFKKSTFPIYSTLNIFVGRGLGFECRVSFLQSRRCTSWATHPVHFALVILEMGVSQTIFSGWPQTTILPILISK